MKEKFTSCKGWFEIEFKPCTQIARKQEFKIMLYDDTFRSNTKTLNFTILCQNKSFQFNKSKLCLVSDVFQKMIETSYTKEAKSGTVEIPDFSPEVIEAFNRVMFENGKGVDENDLTVDLLMFANKYYIISLIKMGYMTLQPHCYNSRLCNSRPYNPKTLQLQDFTTLILYNPKTLQLQFFSTPDFTTPRLYNS